MSEKPCNSMAHRNNLYILTIISCLFILSCGTKKGVIFFEDIDTTKAFIKEKSPNVVYQIKDRLVIRVSSPDNIGVANFNKNEEVSYKSGGDGLTTNAVSSVPYIINDEGFIEFPKLGVIKVAGLTKKELVDNLKEKLSIYIKVPWVDVELLTFKISFLGEVGSPGSYVVENEKINILEAIAMAGDVNITGKRDELLVMREVDGKTTFIEVNLLDESLFNSEAYYLKQNDIVYVQPIALRTREIGWETSVLRYTGIIAFALSIYSILSR
ncbi:polysaccharide export outer membrane protein [Flavobacteriaceae bacterium MAR_2010_188]|nr:polysaccharide export outer membrane protein [Flavobacteriaceae bacterium MAR_2010_188]